MKWIWKMKWMVRLKLGNTSMRNTTITNYLMADHSHKITQKSVNCYILLDIMTDDA